MGPRFFALLVSFMSAAAFATPLQARETLQVSSTSRPGTEITEIEAQAIVAASPASVIQVLGDVKRYPQTMPNVEAVRQLAVDSSTVQHWYFAVDVPFIHDRDYAVRLEQQRDGDTWTLSWSPSLLAPPPREGWVRITRIEGGWTVTPVNGGSHSKVSYRLFVDPAGAIPRFLANRGNRQTIPNLFEAVEEEARTLDEKVR